MDQDWLVGCLSRGRKSSEDSVPVGHVGLWGSPKLEGTVYRVFLMLPRGHWVEAGSEAVSWCARTR